MSIKVIISMLKNFIFSSKVTEKLRKSFFYSYVSFCSTKILFIYNTLIIIIKPFKSFINYTLIKLGVLRLYVVYYFFTKQVTKVFASEENSKPADSSAKSISDLAVPESTNLVYPSFQESDFNDHCISLGQDPMGAKIANDIELVLAVYGVGFRRNDNMSRDIDFDDVFKSVSRNISRFMDFSDRSPQNIKFELDKIFSFAGRVAGPEFEERFRVIYENFMIEKMQEAHHNLIIEDLGKRIIEKIENLSKNQNFDEMDVSDYRKLIEEVSEYATLTNKPNFEAVCALFEKIFVIAGEKPQKAFNEAFYGWILDEVLEYPDRDKLIPKSDQPSSDQPSSDQPSSDQPSSDQPSFGGNNDINQINNFDIQAFQNDGNVDSTAQILLKPAFQIYTEFSQSLTDLNILNFQIGFCFVFLIILTVLARLFGSFPRIITFGRAPTSAYECGFTPFAALASSSLLLFYMLAVFFVVFEAELIFLYPWAASILPNAINGLILPFFAPVAFIAALFFGYILEIRYNVLKI